MLPVAIGQPVCSSCVMALAAAFVMPALGTCTANVVHTLTVAEADCTTSVGTATARCMSMCVSHDQLCAAASEYLSCGKASLTEGVSMYIFAKNPRGTS